MDRWRPPDAPRAPTTTPSGSASSAAQDAFFAAKDQVAAAEDEEFRGNLAVKEELLNEAEAILPVTDLEAAKATLRGHPGQVGAAGKVPRGDVERVEKAMRRVEQTVRDADDQRWKQYQPRGGGPGPRMVDQLEASVAALEADLAKAEATGDEKKVEAARGQLEAQRAVAGPGPRAGSTSSAADRPARVRSARSEAWRRSPWAGDPVASKTPSILRTARMTWPRCAGSPISKVKCRWRPGRASLHRRRQDVDVAGRTAPG